MVLGGLPYRVTARPHMPPSSQINELVKKNGNPRLTCDSVWHPPLKTPLDVCTVLDMLKLWEMAMRQAERLAGRAAITGGLHLKRSEVLRSLRHYLWGTKPSTSHHQSDGRERHRLMKLLMIFLERRRFIFICGGWMLLIMQGAYG